MPPIFNRFAVPTSRIKTVEEGEQRMAVYRIARTRDYTVMANHHLRNRNLSLKAKGLLSVMLSLPNDWNYSTNGLASISKEGKDCICTILKELECAGYICRRIVRNADGKIVDVEYSIFEIPISCSVPLPCQAEKTNVDFSVREFPIRESPDTALADAETSTQLNTKELNTYLPNTNQSIIHSIKETVVKRTGLPAEFRDSLGPEKATGFRMPPHRERR